MRALSHLFKRNQDWAAAILRRDPGFFATLAGQQAPQYLWIGCSDSRVPANQILDLLPGELFVHRNVANVVALSDLNCLSVVQFAVDILRVKHVIVCGHYGCGGVQAALRRDRLGLVDHWLLHVQAVEDRHQSLLAAVGDEAQRCRRLCELNVIEQVMNVCRTVPIQQAWARSAELTVHGWIYGIHDGLLRDLNMCITRPGDVEPTYRAAILEAQRPGDLAGVAPVREPRPR